MGYSHTAVTNPGSHGTNWPSQVDPDNANTVYAGGVNVWKSNDAAGKLAESTPNWYGAGGIPDVACDCITSATLPTAGCIPAMTEAFIYTDNGGNTGRKSAADGRFTDLLKPGAVAAKVPRPGDDRIPGLMVAPSIWEPAGVTVAGGDRLGMCRQLRKPRQNLRNLFIMVPFSDSIKTATRAP
jgi:hypothetical protein